ncbi:MAG: Omp28-related outer membrane protein [Flavobacteriaceae bacterium]|nr:Omp28-related outer membrane protein [Flavobacteriaceae bacterium]MDG1962227.1 Omp28-related outer membrane protein [Flavobacteriaceae bacterium]
MTRATLWMSLSLAFMTTACSDKEDFSSFEEVVIDDPIEIGLSYRSASLRNQEVVFQVFDDQSQDITQNSVFYVDGVQLTANTFSSAAEGVFSVYAEYEVNGTLSTTDTEQFSVIIPTKNVLVEDYTGTWCGYCPAVSAAVDEVQALTDHISLVALHNGDDLSLSIEPQIREGLGVPSGSPRARIDRTVVWGAGVPPVFPPEDVMNLAGIPSSIAIAVAAEMSGGDLQISIDVACEDALVDRKLVVYITEDGLLRDQTNYYNEDATSPYFDQGNPMIDFEQKHVLRATLTDAVGDAIPTTDALTDYTVDFIYTVPSSMVVAELGVVVMVVDSDNTALNTQYVHVGETVPYN